MERLAQTGIDGLSPTDAVALILIGLIALYLAGWLVLSKGTHYFYLGIFLFFGAAFVTTATSFVLFCEIYLYQITPDKASWAFRFILWGLAVVVVDGGFFCLGAVKRIRRERESKII